MGGFGTLVRIATRATKRGPELLELASRIESTVARLNIAHEMLDAAKMLAPQAHLHRVSIADFVRNAEGPLREGTEQWMAVAEFLVRQHDEFSAFLKEVANMPGLPPTVIKMLEKEAEAFEAAMRIIDAYNPEVATGLYGQALEAVSRGEIREIGPLLNQAVNELDGVMAATKEAMEALKSAVMIMQNHAARMTSIIGGAGATLVALKPEEVQAAEDLVEDAALRQRVNCEVEKKARREEPSFGQQVWASLKEGPDTGMMGLSPEVLDWSGAGAITEAGVAGYHYAKTPNQPKCDDPIPQAVTQAEISRMRANVDAAWKTLEQQQIAKEQSPPANQPAAAESTPKFSLGAARG
jgi:hypothetical protein